MQHGLTNDPHIKELMDHYDEMAAHRDAGVL